MSPASSPWLYMPVFVLTECICSRCAISRNIAAGCPIDNFLELIQAEGAPVYRSFTATMSDQPVMQNLIKKRPEYLRRLPTPIADQAAREVVFIPQNVFLGTRRDMEDIVAAVRKVERHCSKGGAKACASAG